MRPAEPLDRGFPERALRVVFYASPLFWVLDAACGWSFRIAALSDPAHRNAYYLGLTAIGGVLWLRPVLTRMAALVEPSINFALLIVGSWQMVFQAPAAAFAGEAPAVMTTPKLINFLLSGAMLWLGIQASIRNLRHGEGASS